MSWELQKQHMDDYRQNRSKALNNLEKQKWFTTPLDSVADLFRVTFNRDTENDEWKDEYTGGRDVKKLQAWRIRIASMSSSARDLRSQFAAWDGHRVRVPLDWDRFEYARTGFNFMKLDHLDQILKDKDKRLASIQRS